MGDLGCPVFFLPSTTFLCCVPAAGVAFCTICATVSPMLGPPNRPTRRPTIMPNLSLAALSLSFFLVTPFLQPGFFFPFFLFLLPFLRVKAWPLEPLN